ncbi:DUF928 domain-containing protein [Leptolyngbya sp. NIES-2104]|uniref:DUF928 domain-containing protein n=1 Tax=Leptolyngbya sp. NIES-2104 TaxID=1552121 RepID=UPI00073E44A2|nr:DUF928 domain-containing protein [Leptolyngbya sp. NIES-2104]
MSLLQWFHSRNIKSVIGCTLIGLIATPTVLAAYAPGNQKPAPKNRRSNAGTTRGCSGGELALTALASRNYIGRSTSQQPTFAWYVPRDSANRAMKFIVYEQVPSAKPKAIRELSLQSSPGVMRLSPDNLKLQLGKTYLWQVIIQCDPDNPSGDLVSEGNLEIVAVPPAVQSKLNQATNQAEKVNIYAEAGFWYDALGEALKQAEASKLGTSGASLLNDLAQAELSNLPPDLTPQERDAIAAQVAVLKQIAVSDR